MKSKTGGITAPGLSGHDGRGAMAGRSWPRRQAGAAALLITMILMVIAGLSALVVSKTAFNEQRLSGTDIRSKEVYNAAFGSLDYAAGRLQNHYLAGPLPDIVWNNLDANGKGLAGATTSPAAFVNTAAGATFNAGADWYTPGVTYTLLTDETTDPLIIDVATTATATNDTQVTKTLAARFMVTYLFSNQISGAPPLVVEGCVDGITGTPDIDARGDGDPDTDDATAIVTLGDDDSSACIDTGHFDFPDGGDIEKVSDAPSLFDMFFPGLNGDRSIIKSWSDAEEAAGVPMDQRSVIYVSDEELQTWNDDVGSGTVDPVTGEPTPTKPVILFFESDVDGDGQGGCVPINGNVTIWGLVFYDQPSCDVTVGAQGGGKAIIYGTMAFSGDLQQFNANTEIINTDLANIPPTGNRTRIVDIMPGSVKDW